MSPTRWRFVEHVRRVLHRRGHADAVGRDPAEARVVKQQRRAGRCRFLRRRHGFQQFIADVDEGQRADRSGCVDGDDGGDRFADMTDTPDGEQRLVLDPQAVSVDGEFTQVRAGHDAQHSGKR